MGQYYTTANISKKEISVQGERGGLKLMESAWINNHHKGGTLPALLLDKQSIEFLTDSQKNAADKSFPWGSWNGDQVVVAGDYDNTKDCIENQSKEFKEHLKSIPLHYVIFKDYRSFDPEISKITSSWKRNELLSNISGNILVEGTFVFEEISLKLLCLGYKTDSEQYQDFLQQFDSEANDSSIYSMSREEFGFYKQINLNLDCSISDKKLFLINYDKKQFMSLDTYLSQSAVWNDGWVVHPLPLLIARTDSSGGGDYYNSYPDSEYVGYWANDRIGTSFFKPEGFIEVLFLFSENDDVAEVTKNTIGKGIPLSAEFVNTLFKTTTGRKNFLEKAKNCIRPLVTETIKPDVEAGVRASMMASLTNAGITAENGYEIISNRPLD